MSNVLLIEINASLAVQNLLRAFIKTYKAMQRRAEDSISQDITAYAKSYVCMYICIYVVFPVSPKIIEIVEQP